MCVFIFRGRTHRRNLCARHALLAVGRMGWRKLERRFKVTSIRKTLLISFVHGVYEFQNQFLLFVFRTFLIVSDRIWQSKSFSCVLRRESSGNPGEIIFHFIFTINWNLKNVARKLKINVEFSNACYKHIRFALFGSRRHCLSAFEHDIVRAVYESKIFTVAFARRERFLIAAQ